MLRVLKAFVGGKNNAFFHCITITILNCDSGGMHVNLENHRRLAHSLFIIAMVEQSNIETHWQVQHVTPQNPLQGHDGHFTPQAQRLKMETVQTFIL